MHAPVHPLNWYAGWWLVLGAFLTGALIGLAFHREDFLGGYSSFRRRLLRLGHIALAALGMMNIVFSLSPWPPPGSGMARAAAICFAAGGITPGPNGPTDGTPTNPVQITSAVEQ